MWPQGQSADAVLALGLGKMDEFNKDSCEFRLAIKSAEFDILSAMLANGNLNDATWGRGVLAKYIVALRTACVDVAMFHNNNNLLTMLETQYNTYKNYYDGDRRALSWYALARCTAGEAVGSDIITRLTATPGTYSMGVGKL
ncbi:hypothetical protein FSP39_000574 [Pinctada imbricata]|uniref:Uncharacterized protein n=1 Tax=Pinctada imbricata TaxID=66713 RepID=A0AA88XNY8_PINIB|nr:hypothetical protein FSP39_000574 [Pinctada imbricata]